MRKLGDDLSPRQLAPLRRAPRTGAPAPRAEKSAAQRERNRAAVKRRSACAPNAKRRSESRAARTRKLEGRSRRYRRRARRHARRTGRPRRAASRRAQPLWRVWTSSSGKPPPAATPSPPKSNALGEQRSRLLTENIELDQRARHAGRTDRHPRSARQRNGRRRMPPCAKSRRLARTNSRRLRGHVHGSRTRSVADRSRTRPQTGRTEVPR